MRILLRHLPGLRRRLGNGLLVCRWLSLSAHDYRNKRHAQANRSCKNHS
jgi:hypothetical protein